MTEKRVIDWEAVELAYRAGVRSLKDIGAEFGVSDAGIIKRAKRDEWVRDLSAKIKSKADAKVSADAVSDSVSALTKIAEKEIVEANAELQARVRREQRKDISRTRKLAMTLLEELEGMTGNNDLLEELGELLRNEDDKGVDKRNDLYSKIIATSGRVDSMKKLADTLKTLIGLEREAFGIDSRFEEEKTVIVNMDPMDTARRVAFLLAQATQGK